MPEQGSGRRIVKIGPLLVALILWFFGAKLCEVGAPKWFSYLRMSCWDRVDAEVISAGVVKVGQPHAASDQFGSGSVVQAVQVVADYTYAYRGRQWRGQKVCIDPVRDTDASQLPRYDLPDFSEFHGLVARGKPVEVRDGTYLRKADYKGLHVAVPAWVNPRNPSESVLFRDTGLVMPMLLLTGVPLLVIVTFLLRWVLPGWSDGTGNGTFRVERGEKGLRIIASSGIAWGRSMGALAFAFFLHCAIVGSIIVMTNYKDVAALAAHADLTLVIAWVLLVASIVGIFLILRSHRWLWHIAIEVEGSPGKVLHITRERSKGQGNLKYAWGRDDIARIAVEPNSLESAQTLVVHDKGGDALMFPTRLSVTDAESIKTELDRALRLGSQADWVKGQS